MVRRYRRRRAGGGRRQMRAVRRYGANAPYRYGRMHRRGWPPIASPTFGGINPINLRSPVPQVYMTKLRANYVGYWSTADAVTSGAFQILGNGCFHPFNVVGATPPHDGSNYNHATIAPCAFSNFCSSTALYSYYRVLSSKIIVRVSCENSTNNSIQVAVAPVLNSQAYASCATADQGPYTKSRRYQINTSSSLVPIVNSMSTHKMFGVSRKYVRDADQFAALFSANPADLFTWQVLWQSDEAVAFGGSEFLTFHVILEQVVMFEERNLGGLSDT